MHKSLAGMVLLLAALWLSLGAAAVSAKAPAILVLGDSLSAGYRMSANEGWVHLLKQRLAQQGAPYTVVNASISGDTSSGGSARLGILLKKFEIAVGIVELGANDGLRAINLRHTHKHLANIITRLQAAGAKVLLLGMRIPPNLGPGYTADFKALYPRLARDHGTALVPFFLQDVAGVGSLMQADGTHPTAAAQPRLLDNVWPYLQPLL